VFALVGLADPADFLVFEFVTFGLKVFALDANAPIAAAVDDVAALDLGPFNDAVYDGVLVAVGLVFGATLPALAEFNEVVAALGADGDLEFEDHVPELVPDLNLEPALFELWVLLDGLVELLLELVDEEVLLLLVLAELVELGEEEHLDLLESAQLLPILQHHDVLSVDRDVTLQLAFDHPQCRQLLRPKHRETFECYVLPLT